MYTSIVLSCRKIAENFYYENPVFLCHGGVVSLMLPTLLRSIWGVRSNPVRVRGSTKLYRLKNKESKVDLRIASR
jgi:hypothetical protein